MSPSSCVECDSTLSGKALAALRLRRVGETAHGADLAPLGLSHRLHREARDAHQLHVFELWIGLDLRKSDGPGQGRDGRHVHAFPLARRIGRVGMRFLHDPDDADHALLFARMIEEAEIALLHFPHIVARLEIAHAVPLGPFAAFFLLVVPGPGFRFRFEQPIGHGAMSARAHSFTGLFITQSQGLISTFSNSPTLANGSLAAIARAASSEGASNTTRLPHIVSPSSLRKGPAKPSLRPRL